MNVVSSLLFNITASFLLFASLSSALCTVPADTEPCDNEVNITELNAHIGKWYKCSACVPDLFQAIQAYYNIPFCGDAKCNGDENCSTCEADCGPCPPPFCVNVTGCVDYDIGNCTSPDPCNVSPTGCEWNWGSGACEAVIPCGNGVIDGSEVCDGTNLGGASCAGFGYDAGDLLCCPGCQDFNLTGCRNVTYTSCNDNDGADYYTASSVDYTFDAVYGPPCPSESQKSPGQWTGTSYDYCNGTVLNERVCVGNDADHVEYDCATEGKICLNRACVSTPEITMCQALGIPDLNYFMNQDIDQPLDDTCIKIYADNVELDCQGNSITSPSTAGISGIYSSGLNTTITNCNVSGIQNGWGIYLNGTDNAYVTDNYLSLNEYGIQVSFGQFNTLKGNTIRYNDVMGIYLYSSSYNNITNNSANKNGAYGLDVAEATSVGNNITGNDFCLNQGDHDAWCDVDQIFSNNKCCCGAECGGSCSPCPGTQIAEVYDCQKLIEPDTVYRQMKDIVEDGTLNCITIAAENITYDGQGYSITKSTSDPITGIYSDQEFTTIMNSNIDLGAGNQRHSIMLMDANNSKLINNRINHGWGVYVWQAGNVEIAGNVIEDVSSAAIYNHLSADLRILNNSIRNIGSIGIQFSDVDDSVMDHNLVENCSSSAIYIEGMRNNITNNTVKSSSMNGVMIVGTFVQSTYSRIINNTILYNAGNGIDFMGRWARYADVFGNTVKYNDYGIYAHYNTYHNNITGNVFCSNNVDAYCNHNQTFVGNQCDSGNVCGGTCIPC
jgi:parallel beta-helix repeat protein